VISRIGGRAVNASAAAGLTVLVSLWLKGVGAPKTIAVHGEPADPAAEAAIAAAGGQGRAARSPTDIPKRGWWQILKRVYNEINDDNVLAQAAAVTFYGLLALFPAMATLVSLYGLIADPKTLSDSAASLQGVVPGGGMDIITGQLKSLASSPGKALGIGLVIGLATSLWSANAGVKALFDALNIVYKEKETRSFVRRTLLSLAFTLSTIVFLIVATAGVVVLPAVLNYVGLEGITKLLLKLARWPALLIMLGLFLSLLYRYGPCRRPARWRWVTWGSAVATIGWLIASLAFSYYVQNFGNYNKTYGTLGAVIGFMTWLWISSAVILIGAELNSEMEHQTARDTTEGPDKPLGTRGATMADRVA
jgi:membrane protein